MYIAPLPTAVAGNASVTPAPTVNVLRASALAERMYAMPSLSTLEVFAVGAIVGVVLSYHRKNRSPIYPLDQFTDLNLTEKTDRYLYTRTTTRTINKK